MCENACGHVLDCKLHLYPASTTYMYYFLSSVVPLANVYDTTTDNGLA
jgi:hypothetical protein